MGVLFVDIETVPDDSRIHLFKDDLEARARREVDREIEMPYDDSEYDQAVDEKVSLLGSTVPEWLRIVGMNLAVDEDAPRSGWVGEIRNGGDPLTEIDLLGAFWTYARQAKCIVGFNSSRFDIPAILVRSALLGVEPSTSFVDDKPWTNHSLDLMHRRWPYRAGSQFQSLKALRRILLPPIPEEFAAVSDMDGGDVGALWAAGDFETCGLYGRLDIWTTRELCRHWQGYFFPQVLEHA